MGLFDRKKINVPAWASFFNEKEYTAFITDLDAYLQKTLNLTYEIHDGVINLNENEFGLGQLGLDNLARSCKQNKTAKYPEIISFHFSCMLETTKFNKEFEKIETDFEKIKKYLAVRLYNTEYLSYLGKGNILYKEFAGELFAVLVFDFPHSVSTIKPEKVASWGENMDELFEIGLENVRRNYKTDRGTIEFGPDKDIIYACEATHIFASNILFDLDMYDDLVGKGGSLVAAPARNIALIYPINDLKVMSVINGFCASVSRLYNDSPGPLTREIYWYKDGEFLKLPFKIDNKMKEIHFYPPEAFVNLLNSFS